VRPFTNGRYELFKGRESYNLNSAQVLRSFYKIGEDLDKYMAASYVLELTEKILPDELAQPRLYQLLLDFLEELELREKKHETLVLGYLVKALDILGNMPQMEFCVCCGEKNGAEGEAFRLFSVDEGGLICRSCAENLRAKGGHPLIYDANFAIVDILSYFQKQPLSALRKLALEEKTREKQQLILRQYLAYHLDVKELKSEGFFREGL